MVVESLLLPSNLCALKGINTLTFSISFPVTKIRLFREHCKQNIKNSTLLPYFACTKTSPSFECVACLLRHFLEWYFSILHRYFWQILGNFLFGIEYIINCFFCLKIDWPGHENTLLKYPNLIKRNISNFSSFQVYKEKAFYQRVYLFSSPA